MKKHLARILLAVLLLSMFPASALAAKASISLGGNLGFLYEDGSVTLKPKLKNLSASDLSWSSSDESVATVEGGTIRAKSAGRTVITVSGSGATARCGVVVLPREVKVAVGETVPLPYGTKESYTMQYDSIASVSKSGAITGKKAGSTLLRVSYGKQKLYVQIQVTDREEVQVEQSKAAQLDCASQTDQIVLVEYQSGSKATLSIHEKQGGTWKELYSCTAYVGKNGIGKTKEGDKRTPTGTFNLTTPFGIKADPGANLPYTQVTKYHYWCGTSGSEYYNQLIDTRVTDRARTSSDEYLISYVPEYNYCMFIDYNASGEAGKGSCIFLHCTGKNSSTGGCVAVPESVMKKIVQWVRPGAKIVIQ